MDKYFIYSYDEDIGEFRILGDLNILDHFNEELYLRKITENHNSYIISTEEQLIKFYNDGFSNKVDEQNTISVRNMPGLNLSEQTTHLCLLSKRMNFSGLASKGMIGNVQKGFLPVDAVDRDGHTIAYYAIERNNEKVIEMLSNKGFDFLTNKDSIGDLFLYARTKNCSNIINLMINKIDKKAGMITSDQNAFEQTICQAQKENEEKRKNEDGSNSENKQISKRPKMLNAFTPVKSAESLKTTQKAQEVHIDNSQNAKSSHDKGDDNKGKNREI